MRSIVVGDIHGCLRELDSLLEKVEFKAGRDRLILCGDLVDRGPDSVGVVARAMEIGAECVVGNHEYKYLKWRKNTLSGKTPQISDRKRAIYDAFTEEQWVWLGSLPYYIHIDDRWTVIHAGCRAGVPIEKQVVEDLVFLRHVRRSDGKRVSDLNTPLKAETHAFWTELWTGPRSIVYGHYVEKRGPVLTQHGCPPIETLGIDTGCAFGGKLTAAILDRGVNFVSVPATGKWAELHDRGD